MSVQSRWQRVVRNLTAGPSELEADELTDARSRAGGYPVAACALGQKVVVTGRLKTVSHAPGCDPPAVEAELFDGSDTVTLIWLGRRRVVGIEPGRRLRAQGRVATRGASKVIYHPYYELEPDAS